MIFNLVPGYFVSTKFKYHSAYPCLLYIVSGAFSPAKSDRRLLLRSLMRIFASMKDPEILFSELGRRLAGGIPQQVVERACRENRWFTPADIARAAKALVGQMLQPEKLAAWLADYSVPVARPRCVLVVMAGNIPLVGFFDLLCVLAAGHSCRVKPSAKDTVLMEYVIGLLREIDPETDVACYDGVSSVDAVIATGGDNANRYFRTRYAGIPTLLRGHRQSVAVLSGHETPEQLAGLSDDIWAYSGLGCRNVSLLFVPEGYDPPLKMPQVNAKYRNNYLQARALASLTGRGVRDLGAALLVEQREFPATLSCIACTHYRTLDEVESWLREHDAELQCVVSECVRHSRRVSFGRAQHPALTDYPDERDVMRWLTEI